MPITRENWSELEGVIDELQDGYWKSKTDYRAKLFNVQNSKKSQENHLTKGAMSQMKSWAGTVNYDTFEKGYEQNYRHAKYSQGLTFEEEIFRFNEYSRIKGDTSALLYSIDKTIQSHAAAVFNNAFNTDVKGPDAVSLCNTSHHIVPGDDAQSNTGVLTMTTDNVDAVMQTMSAFKDDKGDIMEVVPNLIICGNYWGKTVKEICGSDKEAHTADNQLNVFKDELSYFIWPRITGQKWFMVNTELMKMYLNWYEARNPKKIERDGDFDTEVAKFKSVGMWSKGWDTWFWLYGNNPEAA
jgi:hypothetical protein